MVSEIIFSFNIEDTKIHQMLEALKHPSGLLRIFDEEEEEEEEREQSFAP